MNSLINKLNLYEFLSMLVPGCFLVGEIYFLTESYHCCCCGNWVSSFMEHHSALFYFVFFVLSYMTGCMYHMLMDWWWKPFRNNPIHISFVYQQMSEDRKQSLQQLWGDQNKEGGCLTTLLQCPCFIVRDVGLFVLPLCGHLPVCITHYIQDYGADSIIDKYYTAYYYAEKNRPSAPYGYIEGQIAFCRNMIIPVILLLLPFLLKHCWCWLVIVVLVFVVALCVYVFRRQEKLYSLVLEDYEYLKRLENEKK